MKRVAGLNVGPGSLLKAYPGSPAFVLLKCLESVSGLLGESGRRLF